MIKFIIKNYETEETLEIIEDLEDDEILVCLQDEFGMSSMEAEDFADEAILQKGKEINIVRNRKKVVGTIMCQDN